MGWVLGVGYYIYSSSYLLFFLLLYLSFLNYNHKITIIVYNSNTIENIELFKS